ncbi:hypothetical protein SAMN05518865_11226 [Duganella sp. CF458]|uniref:hypothetical protein n=1 Tax=Duganella sp. CF458 TaxID=1884368 RepID=UPI0008E20621|nr:hypothetical protein [Duganella sp. CF458]SFG43167.1 hypothetical protein SAMN05518865_11226 [Duganella sp. CF458]
MIFSLQKLDGLVKKVLDDEADFGEVEAQLDAYIAAHPAQADGYRLRARMMDACGIRLSALADWKMAAKLDPADRASALRAARVQLRWAHAVAEEELGVDDEKDDEDYAEDDDEEVDADPRFDALVDQLQGEALASVRSLAAANAADAGFMVEMLAAVDDMGFTPPWLKYELMLVALAANPAHPALLKQEVLFLARAAVGFGDEEEIPPGHFEDATGSRHHVATMMLALEAVAAAPGLADDGELLDTQAGLLQAQGHYDDAARTYRLAAAAWQRSIAGAGDDDERERAQEAQEHSQEQAALCDGGCAAVQAGQYAAMREATERLREMRSQFGQFGEDSIGDLNELCQQWQGEQARTDAEPTAAELAELSSQAERVAEIVVRQISFDPVELVPQETGVEWFEELAPELASSDLTLQCGFENPAITAMLGATMHGQFWSDARGDVAVVAEAVNALRLVRVVSLLEDGTMLLTAPVRGKSMFSSGPMVHGLQMEADAPAAEILRVHRARLSRLQSKRPGMRTLPLDTLARLADYETRQRQASVAFRMEHGITEPEVLGMHVRQHKAFLGLLRDAVDRRLMPLR